MTAHLNVAVSAPGLYVGRTGPRFLLVAVIALTVILTACSYSTDFLVVNLSSQPVELRYRIKKSEFGSSKFEAAPAKMRADQLDDERAWKRLDPDQYQVDEETRTVTLKLMPQEAVWVTSMFHYFGPEDPNDVAHFPIEEISVNGADGGITYSGHKAQKCFLYVTRGLYTLTYK